MTGWCHRARPARLKSKCARKKNRAHAGADHIGPANPQRQSGHVLWLCRVGDNLKPDITESSAVLAEEIQRAMKGDLSLASRIHTAQAIPLDALFTDMARRWRTFRAADAR
jgi:hypothetical protein